jgi:hypothetical protein
MNAEEFTKRKYAELEAANPDINDLQSAWYAWSDRVGIDDEDSVDFQTVEIADPLLVDSVIYVPVEVENFDAGGGVNLVPITNAEVRHLRRVLASEDWAAPLRARLRNKG